MCALECMCTTCMQVPLPPEARTRSQIPGSKGSCELPSRGTEPCPLEEQQELFTTVIFLVSWSHIFFILNTFKMVWMLHCIFKIKTSLIAHIPTIQPNLAILFHRWTLWKCLLRSLDQCYKCHLGESMYLSHWTGFKLGLLPESLNTSHIGTSGSWCITYLERWSASCLTGIWLTDTCVS